MSGIGVPEPSTQELEQTLNNFLEFARAQKYLGVSGQKISVKTLRNVYNLHFKYATQDSISSQNSPIIDFDTVYKFGLKNGYIELTPTSFKFPRHGFIAQRDQEVSSPSPGPNVQSKILPGKRISINSKKLYYVCTKFQSGFERQLVGNLLELVKPVLFYAMETNFKTNQPIKELQFGGYNIFRLMGGPSSGGGIMVYINKVCEPSCLEELQVDDHEAMWIKLHHPDQVALDSTSETFETWRPVTIVGCIRGGKTEAQQAATFNYVTGCVTRILEQHPDANLLIFGDYSTEYSSKIEAHPKIKWKLVKTAFQTFVTQWKCQHEDASIGWQKLLQNPNENQVFCVLSQSRIQCSCCKISFLDEKMVREHRMTNRHRKNFQAYVYQTNKSLVLSNNYNLFLDVLLPDDGSNDNSVSTNSEGVIIWKVDPDRVNQLILGLRNGDDPEKQQKDSKGRELGIVLRSVEFLKHDPDFEMIDKYGFTKPYDDRPPNVKPGVRIVNGQSLKVTVQVRKSDLGHYLAPIFVIFGKDGYDEPTFMIKEILVQVSNEDVDALQPITEFVQPPKVTRKYWQGSGEVVPGLKLEKNDREDKMFVKASRKLDHYLLKPTLQKLLNKGFSQFGGMDTVLEMALRKYRSLLESAVSQENYKERFALLLSCEEHQMQLDIRNYDMEKVTMTERGPKLLSLEVPGLAENRPSVLKGDKIYARVYSSPGSKESEKKEYEGIVHEVQSTSLLLGFSQDLRKRFIPKMRFDVRFTFNRFPLRNMHRAVDIIGREAGSGGTFWWDLLFPTKTARRKQTSNGIQTFYNKKIESNKEQKLAVEKIVDGGLPGVPYIIFGPPGTGKTVTAVEAIKQIWRHLPEARILAAAPSNAAADLLALRLLEHIPKSQLLRIYAPSRDEKDVPDMLKSASNFINPANSVPILKDYRVLVVTLVTAGRMASADFPDNYFSHVFVDESGHALEPEAVIAVAGIFNGNGHGQLILAGDPKQLGPILRSPIAIKAGLQVSLLERLMGRDIYDRDPLTGNYDNNCITKLLANFRSHPKLLELPSKLFYDSELIPMADPVLTGSLLKWEGLAKQGFPMVFHGVVGVDKREERSPSFFNAEEAAIAVSYVEKLLSNKQRIQPNEIGIISPYRRQVQKLRELMNKKLNKFKNWKDITVGSTEEFQGQERKIIIISTVRSQPELLKADFVHKLGFLRNPKRFNVAITRAKALLIVIGNPFLLCMDQYWRNLIQFSKENGGYIGVKFSLSDASPDSFELTQMEEKFKKMGLNEFESEDPLDEFILEPNVLGDISQKEHVEGQEWRAEI